MHSRTRLALLPLLFVLTAASPAEVRQWKAQADRVTITRDDWGIAHVRGKTDADAVFGMAYAQAEDDFNRVETNYLTSLGRTAEAEGADGRLGGRAQLLPGDASADEAAGDHAIRAVDGAVVQRGQHRRRH